MNMIRFFSLGLLCLLASCAHAAFPTEDEGQAVIKEAARTQSNGKIAIVSFRKTDGVEVQLLGINCYALEFEAVIEFKETCKWKTNDNDAPAGFGTLPVTAGGYGYWGFRVPKGMRIKVKGSIAYQKKESGWQPMTGGPFPLINVDTFQNADGGLVAEKATTFQSQVKRDLEAINAAKEQWALENRKKDTDPVAEADRKSIGEFIKGGFPLHPPGGRYVLTTVGADAKSTMFDSPSK